MKEILEKFTFLNDQLAGSVTVEMILLSLITAFVVSLFITIVYKKTFAGIIYNRNTCLTIALLAMITALIIRTINSNLSLSLGMVGALSIVRFRTAVKEPTDTAFMFWAITAGIMSGAGLYLIAIFGSLLLGLLFYILYYFGVKPKEKYLLVINFKAGCEERIKEVLSDVKKKNLKSESTIGDNFEKTYEIQFAGEPDEIIANLKSIIGVNSVNLVTYQSDFGF